MDASICKQIGFEVYNNKDDVALEGLTGILGSCMGVNGDAIQDVKDVMEIMKSGKWDIEKLITDEYKLDDLSRAIERASDVEHALNVVIGFD